jgi:hypothetical protein
VFVVPTFDATTTSPEARVPVTPDVVAVIGVPWDDGVNPPMVAVNVPVTGIGTPLVTP